MQRPRLTLGRTKRWALLAIPAALLAALAAIVIFNAQRTLTRATRNAASAHNLRFTLTPLDPHPPAITFEPVASTPAYTTGTFFAGSLYLAGASGLTILAPDGTPQRTLRTGIELPVAPITALTSARLRGATDPELLLTTAGAGLLVLTPQLNAAPTLHQLLPADPDLRNLTTLLPLATGELLLGTAHHGLLLYNGATLTAITPSNLEVTSLAAVDSASYLVGTRNAGLFYTHAGITDHADTTNGLPDNQVESIAVENRQAYVGTPTGTAVFSLSAPEFQPAHIYLPGVFAHTLNVSRDELTVGTLDQGIRQIPLATRPHIHPISAVLESTSTQRIDAIIPTPEALYTIADGALATETHSTQTTLTDRNISALAFTPDGTLYIGFFDHGLDELTPGNTLHHLEDDHLFCINRLALDPTKHTIAAATANGLVLFDSQGAPRQTLTRRDGLISDHITDIAFTPTGAALATPAGITFLNPSGPESLYAFQGLVNNHVYALAATPGHLYAGTLGGLSILQSQTIQRNLTVANSTLKHNWITAILPTPDGNTLIGTYGAGIATLDPAGHFTPIDLPANTPRNLVINTLYATPTHLYAGTLANGLLVYSNATRTWSNLTQGLPSLNVTAFAAHAGVLYIGTANGLVRTPEATLP